MKCEATADFLVGGFTDPQGARVGIGALLVGHLDEAGEFVFAGKVGTGFDTRLLLDLRRRLDAIEIDRTPFTRATGLPRRAHWVRPEIRVRVAFVEWTVHRKLQHSRLLNVVKSEV
jgi:bifunctional non-homologous end joining protein LigD